MLNLKDPWIDNAKELMLVVLIKNCNTYESLRMSLFCFILDRYYFASLSLKIRIQLET